MYGLRGLGTTVAQEAACQSSFMKGFFNPTCWTPPEILTPIGVAPAPTGDALTLPPASGEDAAALQQSLSDEAMRRQQGIDAANVKSSWLDLAAGGIVETGNALNPFNAPSGTFSWLVWVAGGLGLAALVLGAAGGGSPRRYGR